MPERPLIAVVDDDSSVRAATEDLLNAAGFSAVTFENASRFLSSPIRTSVACLVADMRMPGMTGLELHQKLAASGDGIPTVIMTAHPDDLSWARRPEPALICCLIKPFTPEELIECVRSALAKSPDRGSIPRC